MKRSPRPSSHSDVVAHADLMRALMLSVTTFMEQTGMSVADIRDVFQHCVSGPESKRKNPKHSRKTTVEYGCDTIAGAVLRAWHKFPSYIDVAARPICLRVDGTEPNLTSLILSQDSRADVRGVIRSMLNAGLLRKHGVNAYLPEKDAATIESLDPLAVDHIAKTVMRLVETASRNIAKSRGKLQLIERYAHVPDLKKSEAKAFAAFSRDQGQACLDTIEDWLETRQAKNTLRSTKGTGAINAGVHIFAYLGEPSTAKKAAFVTRGRKRVRPTPEARA